MDNNSEIRVFGLKELLDELVQEPALEISLALQVIISKSRSGRNPSRQRSGCGS
jgi:hypothetical protein